MAKKKKKKVVTIGQLKYQKRQEDMVMKQLIEKCEAEGINLSKSQLLQKQKVILKKISEEHEARIKCGKKHAEFMKEKDN